MWFIFGSIFFYRSTWGPEKFRRHTGALEEVGTTDVQVKRKKEVVFFRLSGMNQVFGIQRSRNMTQEKILQKVKLGDTMTVYYTDYLLKADKPINLYVTHLQSRSTVFLDYKTRNREYFRTGIILYIIDLFFSILTVWYYRKYSRIASRFFKKEELLVTYE